MDGNPVVICTTVVRGHGGYKLYVNGDIIGTCEGGCDVSENKLTVGLPELGEKRFAGDVRAVAVWTGLALNPEEVSSLPEFFAAFKPEGGGGAC